MVSLAFVCLVSCVFSGALTQTVTEAPSLSTSFRALAGAADTNNDGLMSKEERTADFKANFDTNNDGCIDSTEFLARFRALNFTTEFASFMFWSRVAQNGDLNNPVCKGFNVSRPIPVPVDFLISGNLMGLTVFCEQNPARYNGNSDCNQLPRACSLPTLGCYYSCFNYTLNIASQQLGPPIALPVLSQFQQNMPFEQAFNNLISTNDQNGDGVITPAEFAKDVAIYDSNKDGCIDQLEFTASLRRCPSLLPALNFTAELASFMFWGRVAQNGDLNNPVCAGFNVSNPIPLPVDTLLTFNIIGVTMFCEQDPTRYNSNSDCNQLPRACSLPTLGCYYSCFNYILNIASQHLGPPIALPVLSQFQQQMTFEQAFDNLIRTNDQNGDGVITPAEFAKDVAIYDVNKDSCIDQLEFTAR
ncbi:uncharacterized protein LOC101859292 [Aplysia californica]|uniref:Uncharacterized protein LOC101859292 n=1 Tax=Aplysia californica TaxID=6500 RepID=A0ABM1W3L9_APLCA|nr:uncharacterized protein LOC101859292 [Aplysia californica]